MPRTLSHLLATSTHDRRRNHTCNRSPCQHNRRIYTHQTHNHQWARTPFHFAHYYHLEIRNVFAAVICVLIDTPLVRVATVASNGLPLDQAQQNSLSSLIVSELSGLLVFGVASPLTHQQFCLWWHAQGNDLVHFHHFFHDLKSGNDSLLHDSESSISQWSKFALSQSCCLPNGKLGTTSEGFPQYNKLGSVRHVCELQGVMTSWEVYGMNFQFLVVFFFFFFLLFSLESLVPTITK